MPERHLFPRPAEPLAAAACEDCMGSGWIVPPDGAGGEAHRCHCLRVPDTSSLLLASGCPRRYAAYTRESWEAAGWPWVSRTAALAPLAEWPESVAGDPDRWLVVLYGDFRRRKTSLATAIFGEALRRGRRGVWGVWLDVNDWLDEMEAAIGGDAGGTSRVYMRAREAELLLLDDLGAVRGGRMRTGRPGEAGAWWRERVAALLRHREAWCAPTIVTCNLLRAGPGAEDPASTFPSGLASIDSSLVGRCNVPLAFELAGRSFGK